MSDDRDVTHIIRSWLHEEVYEDADHLLGFVLDELDTTPQRRAGWRAWRFPPMSNALRIAVAAVAVLVVAFLGIRFLPSLNTGSPVTTATPSPLPLPTSGPLEPGSYVLSNSAWTPVSFTFAVPAGWSINADGFVIKHEGQPGEVAFASWVVTHIYGNGCHWTGTLLPVAGMTIGNFANALAAQKERQTSGPVDVTFGGYPAKRVDLSEPAGFDIAACDHQIVRTWPDAGGIESGGWYARAGQTDAVYAVDVDADRVFIDTWHFAGTPDADITQIEGILASIHFRR